MNVWLKISLLLCAYGFFREMRPSEPFVFEFLTGHRNATEQQVVEIIYPMGTYWNFGLLVIVFLVTDMLRYKSVIIFSACAGASLFATLAWTTTFEGLYATQFFYGLFMATEVAYYTYIYAKVDRSHYQQVTSNSRSAILFGRFSGSVLAQLLIQYNVMSPLELNYISFGNQIISLFVSLFLPSVTTSMYFYNPAASIDAVEAPKTSLPPPTPPTTNRNGYPSIALASLGSSSKGEAGEDANPPESINIESVAPSDVNANNVAGSVVVQRGRRSGGDSKNGNGTINDFNEESIDEGQAQEGDRKMGKFRWRTAMKLLWSHFKSGYSQTTVLIWSFWWALSTGGFFMVWSYVQPLWSTIEPDREDIYNGAAEALVTLFGALSAMAAALLNQKHVQQWDVWILTICSAFQGGVILLAALTTNVFVSYAMYIVFGALYHFMITITSATIAKFLVEDSFALIFGINTLFALFFQVLLTVFVASGSVTTLNVREQFVVYGGYFIALGLIYWCSGIVRFVHRRTRSKDSSYDITS